MSEHSKYILELDKVNKSYQRSDFSLKNISFQLPYGTIMGFVGENGAGKTTTIKCILDAQKISTGSIKLFGKELTEDSIDIKDKLGIVYDEDNFSHCLTPNKIAKVMRHIYTRWDTNLFMTYITKFKLPIDQKIATFSKGMKMKFALAVAISHAPNLLVLDEVTSGLDPVSRDEILDVFLDFVQDEQCSIFLSSHITSDLEKVADYITFIDNGSILLSAPKDELLYNYGIIHCKHDQFEQINKKDIIAYRKRDYQIDVLISDKNKMQAKYNNHTIDRISIDDLLLLLSKGKRI